MSIQNPNAFPILSAVSGQTATFPSNSGLTRV